MPTRPAGDRVGRRAAVRRRRATSSSGSRSTRKSSASPAGSSSTGDPRPVRLLGSARFGVGVARRSSGRPARAASAARSTPAASTTSSPTIANKQRAVLHPGRARPTSSPYPKDDLPDGEEGPRTRPIARRDGAGLSSRCTRSACTSAAACRGARRSQWFECPCHGSKYNRVGEKHGGPAPRGLDRFVARRSRAATSSSTPASSSSARRSAPTPPKQGAGRPVVRLTTVPMTRVVALVVWKSDLRHFVVLFNLLAIVAIAGYPAVDRVRRKREPRQDAREPDAVLRRRRPRRPRGSSVCSGWALMFVTIVRGRAARLLAARADPPGALGRVLRQNGSVERGAALFANSVDARPTTRCCRCSARTATAATAAAARRPCDRPRRSRRPAAAGVVHVEGAGAQHRAAALHRPEEVEQIITYGRPGTPMPALACRGGGAKNEQTIEDLVAYIQSIQLTPDEAQKQAAEQDCATAAAGAARRAKVARRRSERDPPTTGATRRSTTRDGDARRPRSASPRRRATKTLACDVQGARDRARATRRARRRRTRPRRRRRAATFLTAADDYDDAVAALAWAQAWCDARQDVSDGQLLFELNCARCHTQGLVDLRSDPARTARAVLGSPVAAAVKAAASASTCATATRSAGSAPTNRARSASTPRSSSSRPAPKRTSSTATAASARARMPGFGEMLTREMIDAIVSVRARRPRQHDVPRAAPTTAPRRRRRPPTDHDDRRVSGHGSGHGARPARAGRQEPLGSDDPRRARRAVGGRAVLRLGVPAARHQPRRPPRLPRRRRGLTGFMVLLSSLWITTATPLNSPKGRPPAWKVIEVVDDPADVEDRRRCTNIAETRRRRRRRRARAAAAGDRRRARAASRPKATSKPPEQPFAQFGRTHRLSHRLRGLPDVHHDRRRHEEPLLAQPAVRGRSSSAPRS